MMDCNKVLEVLGAYALGAATPEEASWVEEHVADCVKCWDELGREQRTAAMLSLAVPIEQAPADLGRRIITQAQREKDGFRTEPKAGIFQRLRMSWPAAAGAFGAASLAAIVLSGLLQMQLNDLQDENDRLSVAVESSNLTLARQLEQTDNALQNTQTLFAVLADDNSSSIRIGAAGKDAVAYYNWSPETKKGFIRCENMPLLPAGKTYEVWVSVSSTRYPVATFQPADGTCQIATDMAFLADKPTGIGISIEAMPGAIHGPTDGWMLYAHFPDN
jgi:hypothetical protein